MVEGAREHFSTDNGGAIVNVAMIETEAGLVVVDTGPSRHYGEALRQVALQVTGKGVAEVILTDHHPDHFFGNQAVQGIPIRAFRSGHSDQGTGRDWQICPLARRGLFRRDAPPAGRLDARHRGGGARPGADAGTPVDRRAGVRRTAAGPPCLGRSGAGRRSLGHGDRRRPALPLPKYFWRDEASGRRAGRPTIDGVPATTRPPSGPGPGAIRQSRGVTPPQRRAGSSPRPGGRDSPESRGYRRSCRRHPVRPAPHRRRSWPTAPARPRSSGARPLPMRR